MVAGERGGGESRREASLKFSFVSLLFSPFSEPAAHAPDGKAKEIRPRASPSADPAAAGPGAANLGPRNNGSSRDRKMLRSAGDCRKHDDPFRKGVPGATLSRSAYWWTLSILAPAPEEADPDLPGNRRQSPRLKVAPAREVKARRPCGAGCKNLSPDI